MTLTLSRVLSLCVVSGAMWKSWGNMPAVWYVILVAAPTLVFIWFPEEVDEFTFGTTSDGREIDAHTPAVMIVGAGWFLLLLYVVTLIAPDAVGRLFGI